MNKCFLSAAFLLLSSQFLAGNSKIDSLENLLENAATDSARLIALTYLTDEYVTVNPARAIELANLMRELGEKNRIMKSVANSYISLGNIYSGMGDYGKSLDYYFKSLEVSEKEGFDVLVASNTVNIASIYFAQNQIEKALEYYEKAVPMFGKAGERRKMAVVLNNIATVYNKQGKYEKSLEYLAQSYKIKEELNDQRGMTYGLVNIGDNYLQLKNYKKALENIRKALKYAEEIGDKYLVAVSCINIAEIYHAQGGSALDLAIPYAQRCLTLAQELHFKSEMIKAYRWLAKIYAGKNEYQKAYEYYRYYVQVKDSVFNEESGKQIAEMQTKYETEKKEKEIVILKKDKEIQNSEVKRQRLMRNSFIGAAALALLLALVLYNRYRIKQKANKQLAEQNERIRLQKSVIEEQKQNIIDSIEYASTIQQAMLPSDDEFKKLFPESFILFKPRDIVSGDFYWVASPPSFPPMGGSGVSPPSTGEVGRGAVLFVTADCTGHGVPGAFMSMLCTALLTEAVNDKGLVKPTEIFEEVRKGIIGALKQRGQTGGSKDGMDATIISFIGTSTYAACANNPVYIVSNNSITEIPPDRFPVGIYEGEQRPFILHEVEIKKGDLIYTVTDGFEDQLGGEKGKKFRSKNLKELFVSIATKPVEEQKNILEKKFEEWKGNGEQTDDVTIIGIRIL